MRAFPRFAALAHNPCSSSAMPVFAFTIGAFGDILSTADLAGKVYESLSKTSGSSEKYRHLLLELDLYRSTLQSVDNVFFARGNELPEYFVAAGQAVRDALDDSRLLLATVYASMNQYHNPLMEGSSGNRIAQSLGAIGWAFSKEEKVKEVSRALASYTKLFAMLLSVSHRCVRLCALGTDTTCSNHKNRQLRYISPRRHAQRAGNNVVSSLLPAEPTTPGRLPLGFQLNHPASPYARLNNPSRA